MESLQFILAIHHYIFFDGLKAVSRENTNNVGILSHIRLSLLLLSKTHDGD